MLRGQLCPSPSRPHTRANARCSFYSAPSLHPGDPQSSREAGGAELQVQKGQLASSLTSPSISGALFFGNLGEYSWVSSAHKKNRLILKSQAPAKSSMFPGSAPCPENTALSMTDWLFHLKEDRRARAWVRPSSALPCSITTHYITHSHGGA